MSQKNSKHGDRRTFHQLFISRTQEKINAELQREFGIFIDINMYIGR